MNGLSTGVPGVGEIHPGAHICALYSGPEERDRLLVPFMQEGQRHGDRCVCLRDGELSVEQLVASLAVAPASSTGDDSPLLRAAAEMSWVQEPESQELFVYESAVNRVLAEMPALFLCMYDLQRFRVGMIVDVLKMHSKVLLDGTVLDNPHCVAPHGVTSTEDPPSTPNGVTRYPRAGGRSGPVDGAAQWLSLTGAEVRVAELVASGMTNRAMAEELMVSHHTVDAHLKHVYVKLGIHSRVALTVLALQHGSPAI